MLSQLEEILGCKKVSSFTCDQKVYFLILGCNLTYGQYYNVCHGRSDHMKYSSECSTESSFDMQCILSQVFSFMADLKLWNLRTVESFGGSKMTRRRRKRDGDDFADHGLGSAYVPTL